MPRFHGIQAISAQTLKQNPASISLMERKRAYFPVRDELGGPVDPLPLALYGLVPWRLGCGKDIRQVRTGRIKALFQDRDSGGWEPQVPHILYIKVMVVPCPLVDRRPLLLKWYEAGMLVLWYDDGWGSRTKGDDDRWKEIAPRIEVFHPFSLEVSGSGSVLHRVLGLMGLLMRFSIFMRHCFDCFKLIREEIEETWRYGNGYGGQGPIFSNILSQRAAAVASSSSPSPSPSPS